MIIKFYRIKLLYEIIRLYKVLKEYRGQIDFIFQKENCLQKLNEAYTFKELNKIKNYCALNYAAVFRPFLSLTGQKPLPKETKAQLFMSVYAFILDDITDNKAQELKEQLLSELKDEILKNITQKDLVFNYYHKAIEAQQDSKNQFNKNIQLQELYDISFRKCGYAFLLLRCAADLPLISIEEQAIYQYGGTAQLGDDILDLYDDICKNQHTYINHLDLNSVKSLLEAEISKTVALIYKLDYPNKNKERFLNQIQIFLEVFTIALKKYSKHKIEPKDWENIKQRKRTDLICDMEHTLSKMQLVWQLIQARPLNRIHLHR